MTTTPVPAETRLSKFTNRLLRFAMPILILGGLFNAVFKQSLTPLLPIPLYVAIYWDALKRSRACDDIYMAKMARIENAVSRFMASGMISSIIILLLLMAFVVELIVFWVFSS